MAFRRRQKPKHIKDLDYWDLVGVYTETVWDLVHAETHLNAIIGHLDTREDEGERTSVGRDLLERWRQEIQAIRLEMDEHSPAPG